MAQTDVLIRKFGLAWSLDIVRLSRENVVSELLFTEGQDLHLDVSLRSFTDVWILLHCVLCFHWRRCDLFCRGAALNSTMWCYTLNILYQVFVTVGTN